MNISEFTVRLLLLFLPGILCIQIADVLTIHPERKTLPYLIHAFIFGVVCYSMYTLLWWIATLVDAILSLSWEPTNVTIMQALTDIKHVIDFAEVGIATLLAVPVSLAYSFCANRKLLHRFSTIIRVTNKFGDYDVWNFTFDAPDIIWALVRDIKNDLMFEGWVRAFSDVDSPRELLLFDVEVYNNTTARHLYTVDALYISRNNEDWTIEFRDIFPKPTIHSNPLPAPHSNTVETINEQEQ